MNAHARVEAGQIGKVGEERACRYGDALVKLHLSAVRWLWIGEHLRGARRAVPPTASPADTTRWCTPESDSAARMCGEQ